MKYIIAIIGFCAVAASPALAFYQPTFLFQKSVFWDAVKTDESKASTKVDQPSAKKWRIFFTNPMS